jgi:hypothetical protein
MIGGFILGGGTNGNTLVVRGIGPSLGSLGVNNVLADPTLELHTADGALVASNDNWKVNDLTQESQENEVSATTLAPSNDLEATIVARLAPGTYTAILRGHNGGTGVGLLEFYNLQ